MASNTRETWKRRLRRRAKAGRKRKNQDSRNSTPSGEELFAGMGKPGEPLRK
jgi:transposase-like protein